MTFLKTLIILSFSLAGFSNVIAQNNTLEYYRQKALQSSPLLRDYSNQALTYSLDSARIRAQYKPQVNLSSSAYYAPVIKGYGYDGAVTNVRTLNGLVNVNQSLDSKKYIKTQLRSVGLQADSILNTSRISEQDLNRSVTSQYITAYGSLLQLEFNQQVNRLLQREDSILKILTRQAIYRQSDYLTFLVTLQQQNQQMLQSKVQFQNDFATLNYLAGIEDTATVKLLDPAITLAYLPPLQKSIFLRQYSLDSLRLINNRKLIDFTYRPRVGVFANAGYNTGFIAPIYNNFGTGFGLNLTMPIYDGGQRRLQYKILALAENTRQSYRDFFVKQYNQQIARIQQQINGNELLIKQIKEQEKYSKRLVTVDFELMQTGTLRVADLVLAINNYLSARYQLTLNEVNRLQLINELNYWNR